MGLNFLKLVSKEPARHSTCFLDSLAYSIFTSSLWTVVCQCHQPRPSRPAAPTRESETTRRGTVGALRPRPRGFVGRSSRSEFARQVSAGSPPFTHTCNCLLNRGSRSTNFTPNSCLLIKKHLQIRLCEEWKSNDPALVFGTVS